MEFLPPPDEFVFQDINRTIRRKTYAMEYGIVKHWARKRLNFRIIRAASMCVRGTRR